MNYRSLTDFEIEQLTQNGCSAETWQNISVSDGFDAKRVKNVEFSGTIKM